MMVSVRTAAMLHKRLQDLYLNCDLRDSNDACSSLLFCTAEKLWSAR